MSLFRSAMGLFRSKAAKNGEKAAADPPEGQIKTAEPPQEQAAAELPEEQQATAAEPPQEQPAAELPEEETKAAAEPPEEQAKTAEAQPEVARRKVKYEARPDPDKPGWGAAMGQDIFKAREDRASQE